MEFAPSGDYVEDWRLQPGSTGTLLSLELIDERIGNGSGDAARPGGAFVQAGDHAVLILDRLLPPPRDTSPLMELVQEHRQDAAMLARLLDVECSYAVRHDENSPFIIQHSTLPFREGETLAPLVRQSDTEWAQSLDDRVRRWRLKTWRTIGKTQRSER